jgi:hypothetical protein
VRFSFRLGGRRYQTTLQGDGKWIDLDCWKLIDRAVAENGLPGRFYRLQADRDRGLSIYLTPEQHEALVKESLATFQSDPNAQP